MFCFMVVLVLVVLLVLSTAYLSKPRKQSAGERVAWPFLLNTRRTVIRFERDIVWPYFTELCIYRRNCKGCIWGKKHIFSFEYGYVWHYYIFEGRGTGV